MLNRQRVLRALEAERDAFQRYGDETRRCSDLADRWRQLFEGAESQAMLAQVQDEPWPGALPTAELDAAGGLLMSFASDWQDHQEARAWAHAALAQRPTIAVDGSQIAPDPLYSIPVGAIQIGWFVNPHAGDRPYIKDIEFTVLPPDQLRGMVQDDDDGGEQAAASFAVQTVNQRRFVRECQRLAELMAEHGSEQGAAPPVAFFDGSFIISFAGKIRAGRAQPYIQAVRSLLHTSQRLQAPLVGFVDTSHSRDIATLVSHLEAGKGGDPGDHSDAELLHWILRGWGDRTPFFRCARLDGLSRSELGIFYKEVVFCYIRLHRQRPPARLEMPLWLLENGQAEEIVNLVRAECVVGAGYPYAIETADALAVISYQDRQRFYALFDRFLQDEGMGLQVARKTLSKQGRR